jgi:ATP-dependent protease ClpP protease subunit
MRRGRYLDAREALDYGLIDEISTTRMGLDGARVQS